MEVLFIRHGKTNGNLEHRYIGVTDEGIVAEERQRLLKKKYNKGQIDHVYVSPMKRCMETRALLFPDVAYTVIADLREMDFGAFENKNYIELQSDKRYQEWIDSNGTLPFPEGENQDEFKRRCCVAFEDAVKDAVMRQYNSIGFVVHGGTIMAILDSYSNPHQDYFAWQAANGEGFSGIYEIHKKTIDKICKVE